MSLPLSFLPGRRSVLDYCWFLGHRSFPRSSLLSQVIALSWTAVPAKNIDLSILILFLLLHHHNTLSTIDYWTREISQANQQTQKRTSGEVNNANKYDFEKERKKRMLLILL